MANKRRIDFGIPNFLETSMKEFEAETARQDLLEYRAKQDLDFGVTDPKVWSLDDTDALEKIIHELHWREGEALSLYEPVPGAVAFHESLAGEVGLVGPNRASKSVSSAVEVAMAATNSHPNRTKYPTNRGLEIAVVGPREEHLRLLHSTLFLSGKTFKVLFRDGKWVVPRYTNPVDVEKFNEWVDARPLIPERMVEDTIWNRKAAGIPEMVKLKNGTTFYFFSFEAAPPRGVPFDLVWLDEEHHNAKVWLTEMRMRMVSTRGRLIWSATPENATITFFSLKSRADRPDMKDKPIYRQTKFFELKSLDNPYLDPEGLAAAIEKVSEDDPDMAAAKVDGEFRFKQYLVYQEFDENKHCIDPFQIQWNDTVHLVIDPSRTRLAVLFLAIVSPDSPHYLPHRPDRLIAFDELVMKGANAFRMAQKVAEKMAFHKHWIQDITVDWTQGRKADEYDVTIAERYWTALQEVGIEPRFSQFVKGNSNLAYGIEEVSKNLQPKDGDDPNFVCMRGKTDTLIWEFKRYHRIKNQDGTPGRPTTKMNDLVDCARYGVCRGLQWVNPPSATVTKQSYTQAELKSLDKPGAFRELMWKTMYGDPAKLRQRR